MIMALDIDINNGTVLRCGRRNDIWSCSAYKKDTLDSPIPSRVGNIERAPILEIGEDSGMAITIDARHGGVVTGTPHYKAKCSARHPSLPELGGASILSCKYVQ